MPDISEKASVFTEAILSAARTRADGLREASLGAEKTALEEYAAAQRAETERRIAAGTADAAARAEKAVTAAALKRRRELLQFREDCAGEVYAELRARVAAYPERPEYPDTLCELLFKALGALPGGEGVTVYLRPSDMRFAQRLAGEVPNARLTFAEGRFALGGLIAESGDARLRADLSFDSALEDLEGRFSELTAFDVEDRNGE